MLTVKASCPPCLDAAARSQLADAIERDLETEAGDVYCAGNASFGGDDPGFVPPDGDTQKCETAVGKAAAAFASCASRCQIKHAGAAFKHKTFDATACDSAGKSSCRAKFDTAGGKLEEQAICPACLSMAARARVADTAHGLLAQRQGRLYCAGTEPLQ